MGKDKDNKIKSTEIQNADSNDKDAAKKKSAGKKAAGTAGGVGAIVLLLALFGNKIGIGGGLGTGTDADFSTVQKVADSVTEFVTGEKTEEADEADTSSSANNGSETEIPETVPVVITEDKVTVNGRECADAASLKDYVESINSDGRKFTLEENNSILATHEWVLEVFEELKIDLK